MQIPEMQVAKEVARLLQRLGLEQNEPDERLAYLSWTNEDGHRLNAIAHAIQPFNDAFLNDLYRTLMQFDSTAKSWAARPLSIGSRLDSVATTDACSRAG